MQPRRSGLRLRALLVLLLSSALLGGCAAVVVGGVAVGASVAHDRRDAGTIRGDHSIEGDALLALRRDRVINRNTNISVTSFNGIVLLVGQVDSDNTRTRAGRLVGDIKGVRRVINEIQIGEPASFSTSSNDAYLTAKVKSSMAGIRDIDGFDASRIKVIAADRSIFLMGLVSREEAHAATERVRRVRGVRQVVKVFEYTD